MSNSSLSPWPLITLQRDLVDALAGHVVETEKPINFDRFDKETRSAMVGTYTANDLGTVQILGDADGLQLRIGTGLVFDAFPVSDQILYVPEPDLWLALRGGKASAVLHLRSMFQDTVARRRIETQPPD
ncbi:MAG: hypothetical protein O3A63_02035 [Proteobacteria bacterium]|nr:hypothetical protein [Pseudomonadota bacterium]